MVKLEIAKRNSNKVIIYGSSILSLIVLVAIMARVDLSESALTVCALLTVFVLLAIFKIIPNLGIRRHTKIGELILSEHSIEVRDTIGQGKYDVSKLKNVRIEIYGYDGQSRTGSPYSEVRPVDGLENKLVYSYQERKYEYEFYIDEIVQLEELKKIAHGWTLINYQVEKVIIR
ncbi:hypothetical protein EYV94_24765 [Puteibacter caeruleilacunae]|nr:hypothetical protein EYV94_24765 [Puteibacter caeruleilacunae]